MVREKRMTQDQLNFWLAIYGAVVASIALGWQIWANVQDRPDLLVSASAPSKVFKPVAKGEHWTFWVTYPVAFMNAGARPITIVSADFSFSLEPLSRSEPKLWNESDPIHLRLPVELFPLKLDSGEARTVPLNLKLESSPSLPFQKGYTGTFKFVLETTSGTINRDARFTLDAVTLNDRSDVLRH